jgi:hypothetical protein
MTGAHNLAQEYINLYSEQREWILKAIPFLKSELWRISDCLAVPSTPSGLGEDLDKEIDQKLEEDHAILTELLREVGALED